MGVISEQLLKHQNCGTDCVKMISFLRKSMGAFLRTLWSHAMLTLLSMENGQSRPGHTEHQHTRGGGGGGGCSYQGVL